MKGFNPYFTGLPILIIKSNTVKSIFSLVSILILLDYLFLLVPRCAAANTTIGFNPYFTGLPILILLD